MNETPFLSLGNQVLAPFSEQIKADQYHKQLSENLWPDLLLPWVGSPSPEQAGLWSGEALPSSLKPLQLPFLT